MENTPKLFAMLTMVVSVIMVLGIFVPAVAYAETPREQYQDVQDKYQNYSDRIQNARQNYQDSREKFNEAKDRLNDTRSRENTFALKQATKDHLNHTIDYTIQQLEMLMIRAQVAEENGNAPFTASGNIQEYIDNLQDLKDDVASAETREDFQAIIKEIRNTWQKVNMESKYFTLATVNNKVGAFIDRSESIAERIQDEIDRQNAAGKDTTELERQLDNYNDALDKAIASHETATELFGEHTGFDDKGQLTNAGEATRFLREANVQIRETNQALREANSILREIFAELKQHRPGSVDLRGTGTLTATGNGKVTLSGDMDIEVSAKSGVLTIADYDGNAKIEVTGNGTRTKNDDGTVKYSGFDGTATISGSSVTVTINGDDIELTAEGSGSAVLKGNGTYAATSEGGQTVENNWSPMSGVDES
ncbi:MAG: hypothetical protein SCH39_11070 [Methanosarcinales archaeon]|nr:hypothetical protein [ANME-2 cluster archaeon]MDW7776857.1 hypothetical protein [Methanosarcinales archaeon]